MSTRSTALYNALLDDMVVASENSRGQSDYGIKAISSMLSSVYKKFVDNKADSADRRATDKFLASNASCNSVELHRTDEEMNDVLSLFKRGLHRFWYRDGYSLVHSHHDLVDHGALGPGMSRLANHSDFYTKMYGSVLSSTSSTLYTMYSDAIMHNPRLVAAEYNRQARLGPMHLIEGNSLSLVPKQDDISRAICTEPVLNMYFQLGLKHILNARIQEVFNINFETQQDRNREMARIGSLTGSFGTIDLESASDTISIRMLEEVLPKPMLYWLKLTRSPATFVDGSYVKLNMISSMGNGFTFPLQTLLFSSAVSAIYSYLSIPLQRGKLGGIGNFGVFGDDIVVMSEAYNLLCRFLHYLGFRVNVLKSFNTGLFRESCGHDYFNGRSVRGVYIKRLTNTQDFFVAINRFNDWTARTGIPVTRTIELLLSWCRPRDPEKQVQFVPLCENEDAGIKVPYCIVKDRLFDKHTGSPRYRRSISKTRRAIVHNGYILMPKGMKPMVWNYPGLLSSFLRGNVRAHRINVRIDVTSYGTKWGIIPNWNYVPTVGNYCWPYDLPLSQACLANMPAYW